MARSLEKSPARKLSSMGALPSGCSDSMMKRPLRESSTSELTRTRLPHVSKRMASTRPAPDGIEASSLKAVNLFGYLSLARAPLRVDGRPSTALAWPREMCHDGAARIPARIRMTPDMDD